MRRISFWLIGLLLLFTAFSSMAVAQAPQYGGTAIVSNKTGITSLNPILKYDWTACSINNTIYSKLIILDYGVSVGQEPYGDLAKSWEVSDDGLTYTFHLHDNVYFHDGVKFSSADVKFNYEIAKEKNYPLAKYLESVEEILAPDENTIVLKLSEVNAPFLPMLALASNWYGMIIPKHLYEGTDIPSNPYNKTPIGTGPFKFEEWKEGQFVSLRANEKYFRGRPYLDKIVYRLYANKEVAQADFRSGNLDLLWYEHAPPAHDFKTLTALPGVKLQKQLSIYGHDIMLNHTRKPTNDIRVREAISLAIDRDQVTQLAWAGFVEPNYHASSIGTPAWTNFNVRWPKKDLKRAKQLLDKAGYPAGSDGIRMKLTAICPGYYKDMTEVIVQQLRKIGIQVKLDLVDTTTWTSRYNAADFDLMAYWFRFGPDPDAYREHFGTGGARNFGRYSNATVDHLLTEGTKTLDFSKRKETYDKIQEILFKDFAYVPVSYFAYFTFIKDKLHGNPMGDAESYGKSFGWVAYGAMWLER